MKTKFEKIVSIEEVGEGEIFDFTVPIYHNYFLNGILNHNSGFRSVKEIDNAQQILDTLTTGTRELPYIGLLTSFPRLSEDSDFTFLKLKQAEKLDHMISCRYPTWHFKPSRFYCGETFDFIVDVKTEEIVKVPIEYKDVFTTNPEGAKSRYMTIMGAIMGSYFEYRAETLDLAITNMKPTIDTQDIIRRGEGRIYLGKVVLNAPRDSISRVVTIDAGEVECETSMCIAHRELAPDNQEEVIVDAFIVWTPDEKRKMSVDMNNIIEVIKQLRGYFSIIKVRSDHWNSASIEQSCRQARIPADRQDASDTAYSKMKELFYTRRLKLPNQPASFQVVKQCKNLQDRGEGKKPKVVMGKQDIVDSLACACNLLYGEETRELKLAKGVAIGVESKQTSTQGLDKSYSDAETFFKLKNVVPVNKGMHRYPGGVSLGGKSIQEKMKKHIDN